MPEEGREQRERVEFRLPVSIVRALEERQREMTRRGLRATKTSIAEIALAKHLGLDGDPDDVEDLRARLEKVENVMRAAGADI